MKTRIYTGTQEEFDNLDRLLEQISMPLPTIEKFYERKSIWEFVEKYFPNYYRSDHIALSDDLELLIEGEGVEEDSGAHTLLMEEYEGDITNPQIEIDRNQVNIEIMADTLDNFLSLLYKSEK